MTEFPNLGETPRHEPELLGTLMSNSPLPTNPELPGTLIAGFRNRPIPLDRVTRNFNNQVPKSWRGPLATSPSYWELQGWAPES